MKKRLLGALLSVSMAFTMVTGCGDSKPVQDDKQEKAAEEAGKADEEEAQQQEEESTEGSKADTDAENTSVTAGDPKGTHFEVWTYEKSYSDLYVEIVKEWNSTNPDKPIELTVTTSEYGEMHTKLMDSLKSGNGAPDICDVAPGEYAEVTEGESNWLVPLNDALSPWFDKVPGAVLQAYQGTDGNYYGAPCQMGAMVMFYNIKAMEDAGFSNKDIDSVSTWNDYELLGKKYLEATGNKEGKYFTAVDIDKTDWLRLAMAECGEDWSEGSKAGVAQDSVKKMLTLQQKWLDEGVAEVAPGGNMDTEEGYKDIKGESIVSFPAPVWYMNRFIDEMDEEEGNWYIAPCPTFKQGQPRSVALGGAAAVVSAKSSDTALAAEFACSVHLSNEGGEYIWKNLGLDACNTTLWTDEKFTHDDSVEQNSFFANYPGDVLAELSGMMGRTSLSKQSMDSDRVLADGTLDEILKDGSDIESALNEAKSVIADEER